MRGVMPNCLTVFAVCMVISTSSSTFGLILIEQSPMTSCSSPLTSTKQLETMELPGAALTNCSAGRTVSAVE